MSANKFRLVTRADFDGAVSGCLLMELEMIGEVKFAEPKQVQDGEIKIDSNDILTNLPYAENAHLCIDHHLSEVERVGARDNLVIDPEAPSAARVVYEQFGGRQAFPGISDEMMAAVDQADAAQYGEADILAPEPWTMLNFMLDPRTGLDRFGPFQISNEQLMKEMMTYLRHTPVEEIMKLPDVEENASTSSWPMPSSSRCRSRTAPRCTAIWWWSISGLRIRFTAATALPSTLSIPSAISRSRYCPWTPIARFLPSANRSSTARPEPTSAS